MWRPLSDYLEHALNRAGAKRSVTAAIVVENAETLLLAMLPELRAADIEVISYRHGTLTVGVSSPAVGQEVQVRAPTLLEALRDAFPGQPLERLRVRPLTDDEQLSRR